MSETEKTRRVELAYNDEKPWGSYEVLLDAPDCKVKRLTVAPGQRLSLQSHEHRQEHWFVVSGNLSVVRGKVNTPNEQLGLTLLRPGQNIDIPRGYKHRAANTDRSEPAVFIEVQTGDYFGEDDNVRYEDDYDRKSPERKG